MSTATDTAEFLEELNGGAFASQIGVKYPTFAAWIAERRRGKRQAPQASPAFLIAEIPASTGGAALEVRLPGGAIARASDPEQLRLLAALLRHLA